MQIKRMRNRFTPIRLAKVLSLIIPSGEKKWRNRLLNADDEMDVDNEKYMCMASKPELLLLDIHQEDTYWGHRNNI